jgi:hypothetical protein
MYCTVHFIITLFNVGNVLMWRSQWPRGLRRGSTAARLLRSWVRIPLGARMFVCCECCVLLGRGLCDGLITRPEESYRLWHVVVCDQETSTTRRLKPATELWKIQPLWVLTPGKQTNKQCLTVRNLSVKFYSIYACYTHITLYHVVYSFRYYPRFHVTAVGLGTCYSWIRGSACIQNFVSFTKEAAHMLLRTDAKRYYDAGGRCSV